MSLNVVLTGKSGLIGGSVYQHLLKVGHQVVTLGKRESDHYLDLSRFVTPELCFQPDAFVHCAGVTDEEINENQAEAISRGTNALVELVDWAKTTGVSKFVYISTAHIYGDLNQRNDENTATLPRSIYGILHLFAEQYIRSQFVDHLILRPCAVYGPVKESFKRWELIPYSFPRDLALHNKISIRSHGKQCRNFVSTKTIAVIIRENLLKRNSAIINPLGYHSISIRDFAELCVNSLQSHVSSALDWEVASDDVYENKFSYQSIHDPVCEDENILIDHLVAIYQQVKRA